MRHLSTSGNVNDDPELRARISRLVATAGHAPGRFGGDSRMAIYHLSAQEFSRGAGHSTVHATVYRARCALADERTGLTHDYSRKAGELLFKGIYAPKDAPEWARDRAQLWNHVEAFERHRRALLAREFNIALPHELTLEQNRHALQNWIRDNFTRKGLIADAVIHAPGNDGDARDGIVTLSK
jgi:MobA/MobL family